MHRFLKTINSGNKGETSTVELWVEQFEEQATVFNWTALQQYVFGKQLMTGAAAVAVSRRARIKSYATLKE